MPLDPISLGAGALQSVAGIVQSISGGIQAHRAQKNLEKLIASYKPNAGLLDYYNKALARYSSNPYQSSLYNQAMKGAGRGLATGISALNDKRSLLGGISQLTQGYDDASLKAAANAEAQQGQELSQLGQAAQVKANEEFKPFDMKYNLLSAKAMGGNQILNSGLSNLYGGLGSIQNVALANKLYGGNYPNTSYGTTNSSGYNANVFDNYTRHYKR